MNAKDVQKLREETGAGVMECKRALEEAKGKFEKAKEIIQEKGLARAEKRAERETAAGLVHAYVHNDRVGALLEIRSETDFVARSEPFRELAKSIAMQIAAMDPENAEELLAQPFIKDPSKTIKDVVGEVVGKVGENIKIGSFYRIAL